MNIFTITLVHSAPKVIYIPPLPSLQNKFTFPFTCFLIPYQGVCYNRLKDWFIGGFLLRHYNLQYYMHNCKTCSVDIHLDNPLASLQLLSRSTYLLYSYNQQIHPNSTKPLPLFQTLTHLNTVYIFTANSVRHQERDSWWGVPRAIIELHVP